MISDQVNDKSIGSTSRANLPSRGSTSDAAKILELQNRAIKISHESWARRKNHEIKLRQQLIIEAKRDLLETLVQKQEEEAMRMQERSHSMFEWENKKIMHQHHQKLVKIQKEQKERLEKQ